MEPRSRGGRLTGRAFSPFPPVVEPLGPNENGRFQGGPNGTKPHGITRVFWSWMINVHPELLGKPTTLYRFFFFLGGECVCVFLGSFFGRMMISEKGIFVSCLRLEKRFQLLQCGVVETSFAVSNGSTKEPVLFSNCLFGINESWFYPCLSSTFGSSLIWIPVAIIIKFSESLQMSDECKIRFFESIPWSSP